MLPVGCCLLVGVCCYFLSRLMFVAWCYLIVDVCCLLFVGCVLFFVVARCGVLCVVCYVILCNVC